MVLTLMATRSCGAKRAAQAAWAASRPVSLAIAASSIWRIISGANNSLSFAPPRALSFHTPAWRTRTTRLGASGYILTMSDRRALVAGAEVGGAVGAAASV